MSLRTLTKVRLMLLAGSAAGLAVCAAPAFAQAQTGTSDTQSSSTSSSQADHKTTAFIKEAARGNDMEIAMGEMAARKAQNADLKSFAQQLQQDHTQANTQLQPIAQKYGVQIDQPMGHKHELSKFEKEQAGPEFDKAFVTEMLRDHQKDIDKFEKAATQLTTPDVKQYAETMLPKLREHFQRAEQIAKEVGVDQNTISKYQAKLPEGVGGTSDQSLSGSDAGLKNQKGEGAKQLQPDSSAHTSP